MAGRRGWHGFVWMMRVMQTAFLLQLARIWLGGAVFHGGQGFIGDERCMRRADGAWSCRARSGLSCQRGKVLLSMALCPPPCSS